MDPEPEPSPESEVASGPAAPRPFFLESQGLQLASRLPASPDWLRAKAPGGLRAYAAWTLPGYPQQTGIWVGAAAGKSAWKELLTRFRGGRFAGSGAHLKCYEDNLVTAVEQWSRVGPRETRGATIPNFFYWW